MLGGVYLIYKFRIYFISGVKSNILVLAPFLFHFIS